MAAAILKKPMVVNWAIGMVEIAKSNISLSHSGHDVVLIGLIAEILERPCIVLFRARH